ncbi:MAG: hypothetical protein EP330_10765 [Deltaproteobacteria bacterium]|nr:MAG: hypothetical protein EP330_10765 [Deltaproteobacteria bacterium]
MAEATRSANLAIGGVIGVALLVFGASLLAIVIAPEGTGPLPVHAATQPARLVDEAVLSAIGRSDPTAAPAGPWRVVLEGDRVRVDVDGDGTDDETWTLRDDGGIERVDPVLGRRFFWTGGGWLPEGAEPTYGH